MKDRLKEPSTWGGFGLILIAINQIFDVNEAGEVGQAISNASQSGSIELTIGAGLAAIMAMFLSEKKGGK